MLVVPALGGARLRPRDELEVGAVLEGDERVVRGSPRVAPAGHDGEAESAIVLDGLREVRHRDHDVVQSELHPTSGTRYPYQVRVPGTRTRYAYLVRVRNHSSILRPVFFTKSLQRSYWP